LSAAHRAGIVHRDLKPENLFLVADASARLGFCVKVLDFGIAKVKRRDDSTVKTQAGLLMGSPAYMSPEQCRDSSDVDHRTDIYSLAVIVYEMLVGAPPFSARSATEMLVMQMTATPPRLRDLVPDLPEHVEQAVACALSKDREHRYTSIDSFVAALRGAAALAHAPGAVAQPGGLPLAVSGSSDESLLATAGPLSSRFSLTPVPLPLPDSTVTTLSGANGEAGARDWATDAGGHRGVRWPWLAVAAVMAAGTAILAAYLGISGRPRSVKAPSVQRRVTETAVRVHVQSSPPGAIVLDTSRGSILGVTPLDSTYARGSRPLALILRLDGYEEKTVSINLDGNSSTSVDLQRTPAEAPLPPEATGTAAHGDPARTAPRKPSAVRKPTRPAIDEEQEWRVH
jgi:serine/threonine-protein kinase